MTVTLRRLRAGDGARVLRWRNGAEVAAFMYTDHAITEAEHATWLKGALTRPDRRYWIIEMDGAPVGLANLADIDPAARRCAWAYYLAEPATRGRGVGSVVEYMVVQYVFETLSFNKLWCEVLLENQAVWRLHEGFGFQREAHYRDHVWKSGRFQDVLGLGLLAADWAARRPDSEARFRAKGVDPQTLAIVED